MPTDARTSQDPVEVVTVYDEPVRRARISQDAVETVTVYTQAVRRARVSQMPIEVLRTFSCGDQPPIPGPPVVVTVQQIRRLRRAPHVWAEKGTTVRLFCSAFQVDLQPGIGNTNPPGYDPQVVLRVSKDGGATFGNELAVSAGKLGAYFQRAIWRRLGAGRDWVFEITVSDPVAYNVVAAYLDVQAGES